MTGRKVRGGVENQVTAASPPPAPYHVPFLCSAGGAPSHGQPSTSPRLMPPYDLGSSSHSLPTTLHAGRPFFQELPAIGRLAFTHPVLPTLQILWGQQRPRGITFFNLLTTLLAHLRTPLERWVHPKFSPLDQQHQLCLGTRPCPALHIARRTLCTLQRGRPGPAPPGPTVGAHRPAEGWAPAPCTPSLQPGPYFSIAGLGACCPP